MTRSLLADSCLCERLDKIGSDKPGSHRRVVPKASFIHRRRDPANADAPVDEHVELSGLPPQDRTALLTNLEFVATAGRIPAGPSAFPGCRSGYAVVAPAGVRRCIRLGRRARIVELRKGDSSFGACARIPHALDALQAEIAWLTEEGADIDDGTLSYRLARNYADYNQIHPFREGNGRTGTLLLHLLGDRAGRRLFLDGLTRSEWISPVILIPQRLRRPCARA